MYLGLDEDRRPCCFFMTASETFNDPGENPLHALWLGLSAVRQDLKGSGYVTDLWNACRDDTAGWLREHSDPLVLWGTCATPSAYRGVEAMVSHLEPDLNGNYTARGCEVVKRIRKHRGWQAEPAAHPFALKGVAVATRYSTAECARIALVNHGFSLLERLGIDESRGDRLLFVGFIDGL